MSDKNLIKAEKLVSYLLIILLISVVLNLLHIVFFSFNSTFHIANPRHLSLLRISYVIQLLLTVACVLLIWMNTKTLSKGIHLLTLEKDNIAADKQVETDTLNHMVQNLSTLYTQAVENDTLRTEFYSNYSHEIKTPLSVILGAIQLMERNEITAASPALSKHLQTVKQNSYRVLRLVNNLLDSTRMDYGAIKLQLENCNIVYLVEEMVQSIVPFAEEKSIQVEFDTEEEEIITAVDLEKMERIMLNLLSNAIKFTPSEGNIWVTVSKRSNWIQISVKDTGPGIPKDMQALVFNRFQQVSSPLTKNQEGSGIGLSLVKSFVELHNGKIELLSEENEGCEFIVELPIAFHLQNVQHNHDLTSQQNKIVQAIQIEFSDIYAAAASTTIEEK